MDSALLAEWIESNILLQLASAPFDKQDETLVPAVGSCGNCPKRTGFNKLLFADVRKDSCTDPQCLRAKIDAHVADTRLPLRSTGIPDSCQCCTTAGVCPRNLAIAFQPTTRPDSGWASIGVFWP